MTTEQISKWLRPLTLTLLIMAVLSLARAHCQGTDPALRQHVALVARAVGVPPATLMGMVAAESGWRPGAVGRRGEVGLMQVRLSTAREATGNPRLTRAQLGNPYLNVSVGGAYLGALLRRYRGDLFLAVTAYNRGPGAVDRDLRRGVRQPARYWNKVNRKGDEWRRSR